MCFEVSDMRETGVAFYMKLISFSCTCITLIAEIISLLS